VTDQPTISASPDLKGRRVLIVDDDRLNLRILSGILKSEGYVLAEADTGERALEVYAEFHPHLVLLDVMMPGIDGFEACRSLKKTYGDDCAPVIFITAKNLSDDVVEGLNAGGADYLPKPFKAKEVLARIRSHLHNQLLAENQKLLVEQLNKANASKTRFLGMAAHDLRNPLSSIRGLAEFLRDGTVGPITSEQLELVDMIHSASQSMLTLVNELLDVATIESGELKIVPEPSNVTEIITKSVYLTNIEAAKKQTHVNFEPAKSEIVTNLDGAKIRQVVDNLLSNAVKYSPPGSIITVEVREDSEQHTCGFSVKDQGPGIPESERHKLFKDFGRLSVQPTAGENSTGLGLAICRKIVEAHHGSIIAENLPSRGCEFRVTLPLPA
jgi:two-component system, sensor histidine kinase and response regulator